MDKPESQADVNNMINRIAGQHTQAEVQRETGNKVPVDRYAETSTGRALADIIDELSDHHDEIDLDTDLQKRLKMETQLSIGPSRSSTDSAGALSDGIGVLMQEMENRLRAQVDLAVRQRCEALENEYRDKLARMRELTNQEIAQREAALRRRVAEEYSEKERLLRSYYKKLIALANGISRQKARLQDAKKQFERKLTSANQLYREVEEMRTLLSEQIGYIDAQEMEEVPALSMNL